MEVVLGPSSCKTSGQEVGRQKTPVSHCSEDLWSACYPHSWALSQECNWSLRTIECERKDVPWCQIPRPTRPESTQQVLGFCSWCWLSPCAWPITPNLSRQKPQLQRGAPAVARPRSGWRWPASPWWPLAQGLRFQGRSTSQKKKPWSRTSDAKDFTEGRRGYCYCLKKTSSALGNFPVSGNRINNQVSWVFIVSLRSPQETKPGGQPLSCPAGDTGPGHS